VLPMGLGIGLGALVLVVWKRPGNSAKMAPWGIGAGLLWNVANLSSFLAVDSLGYAVGFPLTQMALVVSILWGILLFREAPTRAHKVRLAVAALFLLTGAALLALGRL
jgi:glucose uptake protein